MLDTTTLTAEGQSQQPQSEQSTASHQPAGGAPAETGEQKADATPDWRLQLAGEDTKALDQLARYKSPEDFWKSHVELRSKLSERPSVSRLGDDATPEQIAEYRQALGLPEVSKEAKGPDYLKAFGVAAPEGVELTELDSELLHGFAQTAYERGYDPRFVKEAVNWHFEQSEAIRQAGNERNTTLQKEWQADLRQEYGREYDATIETVNAYLTQVLPDQDLRAQLMTAQLSGGGLLGDHPEFVKLMLQGALNSGLTDRIAASSMESGGRSLVEQQREIEGWQYSDPGKYNAKDVQARLDKIISARLARGEIDEMGNEIRKRG